MSDKINSPAHYAKEGEIECIVYMKQRLDSAEFVGYLNGNVIKYLHRWRHKGGIEDLKKARWYIDRLISEVDNG